MSSLVGKEGIEPSPHVPKTWMQPLHHIPTFGGQPGNRTPNSRLQAERVPVSTSRPLDGGARIELAHYRFCRPTPFRLGYPPKLGPTERFERSSRGYKPRILPLNYEGTNLGRAGVIETPSLVWKTRAHPIYQARENGASDWNRTSYLLLTMQAHILMCFTGVGPRAGLEPATYRLRGGCSAIELPRHLKNFRLPLGEPWMQLQFGFPYVHTPPVVHGVAVGVAALNFISELWLQRRDLHPRLKVMSLPYDLRYHAAKTVYL